ncbi:HAMP domain-containing sensor histidine kinase [Streptosporangium sp. NPDC048865]|uniref:HAMP domain-containing sensor histidine kinase n=1 Tax=Streptosporangium sp. NPDC048865 TaxID=3155766 RepID=UPI00341E180D
MGHAARAARGLPNWRSLRWKIAALVTVASCAVALAVGVLVHRSTLERSMSIGRSQALTALVSAVENHRRGAGGAWSGETDPDLIPPPLLREVGLTRRSATWYDDRDPDIPWMWAAEPVGDQVVAVQIDMGVELRSRQALDRHIVMAALAALGVVVPLAALAAELPGRRLRRVARTARRIADGDLNARTSEGGRSGDEITEISATVDSMADSLQDRLLSEQRFTADVAHELRTPLMGLVTSAELLPEGEATELVRDRVRVLRALVEDLLEISRLDAGAEHADLGPVALGDVVEGCLARTGLQARLTITGDGGDGGGTVAETDPRRLDRIVANLVANAHRHGRAPVEVTVDGTTIVVRDHGPGFPGVLLEEGPQRFRTGAAERGCGHGLGLTIALGQARVIGAGLTLANAADGGAIATLRLRSLRSSLGSRGSLGSRNSQGSRSSRDGTRSPG